MLSDFRLAFRALTKSPGFTITALLVLTLGIGLNTAMFSFIHAMVFSARPFPEAGNVVQLYSHDRLHPEDWQSFSYESFRTLRQRDDLFTGVVAQNMTMVGLGEDPLTRRVFSAFVSANFFDVLGVQPRQGRGFLPAEETPGANQRVMIVSYPYWEKTGFAPGLIGSTLRINQQPFTVIGIMPEGFSGTMMLIGTEFYFPLGDFDSLVNETGSASDPSMPNLMLVGRLRAGITQASANSALDALAGHMEKEDPVNLKNQSFMVGDLPRLGAANSPVDEVENTVFAVVLLGLAGAVLLLVCLNLAGLLLAKSDARRREIAIRLALGSGRGRIIRQLLVEGLVLSFAGGVLGFLAALWASDLVLSLIATMLPVPIYFAGTGTWISLIATGGFCILATVMFALAPALRLSHTDVLTDLKQQVGEDKAVKRWRWWPRHPLVMAQIAVSLALLITAGLFIRMAHMATHVDFGFNAEPTLIAELDAHLGGLDKTQRLQAYQRIETQLGGLPGVESASLATAAPYGGRRFGRSVRRAGPEPAADATPSTAAEGLAFPALWNAVGSDYLATMGIPLLRGRGFTAVESISPTAAPVAIIDEVLARKLWPEGDALGQFIQFGSDDDPIPSPREIVGISRPVRSDMFEREPRGMVYVPFAHSSMGTAYVHVRSRQTSPEAVLNLLEPLRHSLSLTAPGIPVMKLRTFTQHRENSAEFWALRLMTSMFLIFGLLALGVAVIGIYGIKAYTISRRTKEIGIRMALGAKPGQVHQMFLREGLQQTLGGILAGTCLGVGISIILDSVFVDMAAFDPIAYSGAAICLATATLLACWLPARKAALVDPNLALRVE
ncbi:MAG: ABC transporter permease [Cephaloticoccus sp.]|nr:ABC transporter permease [Cephaloticoccus sp.]